MQNDTPRARGTMWYIMWMTCKGLARELSISEPIGGMGGDQPEMDGNQPEMSDLHVLLGC